MKPIANIECIDKICCDFEDFWEFGLSLDNLRSYVAGHFVEHSADFATLLVEIAQIDVEHRWHHIAKLANQQSSQELPNIISQFENIPSTRDYLRLVPENLSEIDQLRRNLLDSELMSRCKFGDSPLPSSFGIPRDLWQRYEKHRPLISLWQNNDKELEIPLTSPLLIGRQNVAEPEPMAIDFREQIPKLICSSLQDKTISRNQIEIKMLVGNWIEISNSSHNRHFTVVNQAILPPSESAWFKLPCIIDLGSIKIKIRRPLFE